MEFLCFQQKIYFWTSKRVSEMQKTKLQKKVHDSWHLLTWRRYHKKHETTTFLFSDVKNNLIFLWKSKRRNEKSVTIQKDTATDIQTHENRDFVIVQKENERFNEIDSNN